jgi:hypothetical protein
MRRHGIVQAVEAASAMGGWCHVVETPSGREIIARANPVFRLLTGWSPVRHPLPRSER